MAGGVREAAHGNLYRVITKGNVMLDTTFLRFVAILLITNSHLDKLYPVSAMATGGQLGNSLFFMLSGFGLAASYRKKGDVFGPWLQRRLSRIYPPVLLVTLTGALLTGAVFKWGGRDYLLHLLWPTEYWFIAAIVCFYIPFYWLMTHRSKSVFLWLIVFLYVPYFYFYLTALDLSRFSVEDGYFKWIFYFQVMLLGGFLAYRDDAARLFIPANWNLVMLVFLIAVYFAIKLFIAKNVLTEYQFVLHVLTFPIMVASLHTMHTRVIKQTLMQSAAAPYISLVAGATLEIYLLQKYVYGNPWILSLPFPFNIIVFWPIVILGAILIARLSAKGNRFISMKLQSYSLPILGRTPK